MLLTDRPLLDLRRRCGRSAWRSSSTARRLWPLLIGRSSMASMPKSKVAILRTSPGHGAAGLPLAHEPGGVPGRHRQGRGHRAQGQHLLALLLSRQLDDAVAARRRDPGDEAGRLRSVADARLPQPHRRHRRASRRAREQAGQRRRGARPAEHPHLRDRGVDQHPRRGRRPDARSSPASTRSTRRAS